MSPSFERLGAIRQALENVLLGKGTTVRLALAGLLAGGHLLLEDLPGVGKTTLAQALARVFGLDFGRVQGTNDLLPSDLLGLSVYDEARRELRFVPGPIFHQVLLADELNRASPKTQSALLEAMAERQVTVDGISHPLPEPFCVIATQNPLEQVGTYPLPESELDRFLLRLEIGYPPPQVEKRLLAGEGGTAALSALRPLADPKELRVWQAEVRSLAVREALLDYVLALVQETRTHPGVRLGLSPRGGLALLAAARAHAFLAGREFVLPEDVQAVFVAATAHRLVLHRGGAREDAKETAARILSTVPVP
ncbi:MAG: AAA family ATPase [Tepidiphilus sp.]|jgi:MoxR-like ATPase|uniref:MoxR-like ATPase n=1 Tax=Tepidiphilus thermophilus TaxID=876478 RepID=A0A0K6IRL5_9PROT|nr:AAA family ATPase [Tepidiphilus thermophilus]MBP6998156.1 AAA family ATPase [Tepidiphilus sp.]MDK2797017.1 MoxR-like ATPase [Tepidiphilus sp.]CUB05741.1 MoxR-like ATPase [Tepidiphilus thermophilus]